jgi:hypothetical protein
MTYSGKYRPVNITKYAGNYANIKYRSLWERQVFKFLDENPNVLQWSSEEVIIPYRCKTDNKIHRYFVDLKVKFSTGQTYLIEIKPKKQTQAPKVKSKKTKAYITEVLTYAKNQSKWEAASEYCADRGWIFEIWTEDTIKGLGIKLLT